MLRRTYNRPKLRDREPGTIAPLSKPPNYAGGVTGRSIAKDAPIEHEGYRRLVAALPCKACRREGYSQAAHVPPDGKGIKHDDRLTFPLCCTRLGVTGCHVDFDQYRMFPSDKAREIGRQWAAETRAEIEAAGQWPQNLERWSDA